MAFVFMGAEQVLSGDVVSGLTISLNAPIDAAIVASGGIIVSAVVSDFGQTDIESGGEAIRTTVLAEGKYDRIASDVLKGTQGSVQKR